MWLDNRLIYRTKLPVVSAQPWHYIQMRKWSAPVRDYQLTLLVPDVVLRNTETGQLDISPACYGERPRICRKGLLNPATLHPCITRLLSDSPGYDPQCAVTLQQRFSSDVVHHFDDNSYILQTGGTELILRCTGQAEQKKVVAPGVYEIALKHPCSLHGNNWTLTPIFQRTNNVTFEPVITNFVFNMSLTHMLNFSLELDPTGFNLDELSPVDRRQIQVLDFVEPRIKIPSKMKSVWHSFWLLTVVGLVGAAVYGRYRYVRRRPAKPVTEIELQEVEAAAAPTATVPSSPDSSEIFQFRAPTTT